MIDESWSRDGGKRESFVTATCDLAPQDTFGQTEFGYKLCMAGRNSVVSKARHAC